MLGGLGVQDRCPQALEPPFIREISDIDLITPDQPGSFEQAMISIGCTPDKQFNLYQGHARQIFKTPGGAKVDVFIKTFSMCHTIPLEGRFPPGEYSLAPTDLVLTKLQIHQANYKDFTDAAALIIHTDFHDPHRGVDPSYLALVCSRNWGLYQTLKDKLEELKNLELTGLSAESRECLTSRVDTLVAALDTHPKTLRWKLRNMVGRSIPWYDLPEDGVRVEEEGQV